MEDNSSVIKSNKVDASVKKTLRLCKNLMLVGWAITVIGWALSFFGMGVSVAMIGFVVIRLICVVIGIQFVRQQKLKKGIPIAILGIWTFGIWPYFEAKGMAKSQYVIKTDYDSVKFKKSLLEGYSKAFMFLIIGTALAIFGSIIPGLVIIGVGMLMVMSFVIGVQHIRQDHVVYGILITILGPVTCGIWPVFDSYIRKGKLKQSLANV